MSFDLVVTAVVALDPPPRGPRWRSLSYCVLDAVWSIAARYDAVVVPLVRRVAERNGDLEPVVDSTWPLPPDPLPLPEFLARYPTAARLQADANRQRTSTRGGIDKAEAVLRYAEILVDHGVCELADIALLLADRDRWDDVNLALASVAGEGQAGVRRGYLWMLSGSDDLSKPDRMIRRWLDRHGCPASPAEARVIVERVARELSLRLDRPVTPWMVDHAIWKAESTSKTTDAVTTIVFDVAGWPPIKNEATSLFAAQHPQRERVERLLTAAAAAVAGHSGWTAVSGDIALDVTVRSPAGRPRGDATNYLGGIADVLQGWKPNASLDLAHLGELAHVAIFADDRQVQEIGYRVVPDDVPSYTVHLTHW